MTLHVIFASESNGQFVYNIKEVTIAEDHIITIATDDLELTSKEDLIDRINALN